MTTLTFSTPGVPQANGPAVGERARDVQILDATASPTHLADLWMDAPRALVLSFVRQYGCPLCRQQVSRLRRHHEAFAAEGILIAIVGQGSPADAARFQHQMALPFPVLSDDRRSAYATYGLADGTLEQVYSPVPGKHLVQAMLGGHLPHRTVGSVRQLPGTFVIDRNGIVRIAHAGRDAADVPVLPTLLDRIVTSVPRHSGAR